VVAYLLSKGADPKLLDNAAIKFADLTGNRRIYDMLRKAGAPEPAPYGFLDLKILLGSEWLDTPEKRSEKTFRSWNVESLLSQYPAIREKPASTPARDMKIAVVPGQPGMENTVALLTDALSKLPKTVLLEREELRKTLAEQKMDEAWGGGAAGHMQGRRAQSSKYFELGKQCLGAACKKVEEFARPATEVSGALS